jgi:hypothetical protein
MWFLPDHLMLPPSYHRGHFDAISSRGRLTPLVGEAPGALPIPQDVRISRLTTDAPLTQICEPASPRHGVYVFVLKGAAECAGVLLSPRDSMGLTGGKPFALRTAPDHTDVLLVETIL